MSAYPVAARITFKEPYSNQIFVFGSNEAGIHGAGAAREAYNKYGAKYGVGEGFFGRSYAIPTKDRNIKPLPLPAIKKYVDSFITFAKDHSELSFYITAIGCGLAGYTAKDIAPMFHAAPLNCELPNAWSKFLPSSSPT